MFGVDILLDIVRCYLDVETVGTLDRFPGPRQVAPENLLQQHLLKDPGLEILRAVSLQAEFHQPSVVLL